MVSGIGTLTISLLRHVTLFLGISCPILYTAPCRHNQVLYIKKYLLQTFSFQTLFSRRLTRPFGHRKSLVVNDPRCNTGARIPLHVAVGRLQATDVQNGGTTVTDFYRTYKKYNNDFSTGLYTLNLTRTLVSIHATVVHGKSNGPAFFINGKDHTTHSNEGNH